MAEAIASGLGQFDAIKSALKERETQIRRAEAELAEMDAAETIVLHPHIVEAYRRRIADLGSALAEGAEARQYLSAVRNLIACVKVRDDATQLDKAAIEIHGSLDNVVALASNQNRGFKMVAEEGLEPPTRGL